MWSSKDLTLVTVMAALGAVTAASIVQMGYIFTGLPGVNCIFIIFLAIQTGFSLLIYQGRRWRFFAQMTIFSFLIIPTGLAGAPFDFIGKFNYAIAGFFVDLIANSVYNYFRKQNKLRLWSIFSGGFLFWTIQPIISVALLVAFYAPSVASTYTSILSILYPLFFIEAISGSYTGYKIYKRIYKEKPAESTFY
jgi:hypothetical protein